MIHPEKRPDGGGRRWVADAERAARAGDWDEAISLAERALAAGLQDARLLQFRALGRERAGRLADAAADLERARALDDQDPGIANALASNLTRLGRCEDAKAVLLAESGARPEIPETWFNLGAAHLGLGDLGGAERGFARAATLRPTFVPALGKLAVLAAHRGDAAGACAFADRALALAPANADARRAAIEARLIEKRAPDAERAARDWLDDARLDPVARSHACGLLGDALDMQGRTQEAFVAYSASKAAFAHAYSPRYAALERTPLATTLAMLEQEFKALPTARWGGWRRPGEPPAGPRMHVFLMGFMRSGTTLLEQALSQHPDVAALEETEAMAEAGAAWLGQPRGLARIADADAATLDAWRAAYWNAVRRAGVEPHGRVFVDKLPFNGVKLPLIARLFPDARVVFAIRDPRDVVLSCFRKRLQPNGFSFEMRTLEGAASFYASYMSLVRAYRNGLPTAILDHRHEALLADFQGVVEETCRFVGLDFRPEMIDFHAAAEQGRVMSQTARQLREGLNRRGLNHWRAYAAEMAPVAPILAPWVEAYGYGDPHG